MHDLIYLDRDDDVAVLYSDTRSSVPDIAEWEIITGNQQGPTSNVAMMHTLGVERVVFSPSGYIAHRLGLGHYVDPTTASTTGFMDRDQGVDIILAPGDAGTTALGIGEEHIYMGTTGWHASIDMVVATRRREKHTLALENDKYRSIAAVQAAGSAREEALRLFPIDGALRFAGVDIPTPPPTAVYKPQESYEQEKDQFATVRAVL